MKKCNMCGTPWQGYRSEPRTREVCEGCGRYLRCCTNCHHFDRQLSSACTLKHTKYVGGREVLNYCEDFKMLDTVARAREEKVLSARQAWDKLFKR